MSTGSLMVQLSDERMSALAERIMTRLREPEPDRWLTTGEAAEYLSMHPQRLRQLAAARASPSSRASWVRLPLADQA